MRASAFARAINRVLDPVVQLARRHLHGRHRRSGGRARRQDGEGTWSRRPREHPRRQVRAPGSGLPRADGASVLLRGPALAAGLGRGHRQVPSAGPYYVKEYRAGEGIVIRRNRFYGGERNVHLNGFDVNLRGGSPVELLRSIDRGDADWGCMAAGVFTGPGLDLEAKYGLNRSRFHIRPGLTLRMLAFNSSRPLFRNNPRLRRAVNFALDRLALVATSYGPVASTATDQHLPHGVPGFRDAHIYPCGATSLARGSSRAATCEPARPCST